MASRPLCLPRGLIVSCQAFEGEPLFGAHFMAAMARATLEGGAVAVRANSPADIAAIREITARPIIGLYKIRSEGSPVYITPHCEAATAIAHAGCDIVAVDATDRPRAGGVTLKELVEYTHRELHLPVMADVCCIQHTAQAEALGVDILSTTLAGYVSGHEPGQDGPDFELLEALVARTRLPVVAEGRYREPWEVTRAFGLGAHAVVIGGAITRPQDITRRFAQAVPRLTEDASPA